MTPKGYKTKTNRRVGTYKRQIRIMITEGLLAVLEADAAQQHRSLSATIEHHLTSHSALVPNVGVIEKPGRMPRRPESMREVDVKPPVDYHRKRRTRCVHMIPPTSECLVCDR